jgi:hypothetical protein
MKEVHRAVVALVNVCYPRQIPKQRLEVRTEDTSGAALVLFAFLLVAGAVALVSPAQSSELRRIG